MKILVNEKCVPRNQAIFLKESRKQYIIIYMLPYDIKKL